MSHDAPAASARRPHPVRRTIIIVASVLVAILLFIALWVIVRGVEARDELSGAIPTAHRIERAAVSGNTSTVAENVRSLQTHTARAVSLTSDPIWRLTEHTPFLGGNLVAIRQAAGVANDVAVHAAPPLVAVVKSVKLSDLLPKDGAIDLQPLVAATPTVTTARVAMDAAQRQAAKIDVSGTLPAVSTAVTKLLTLVDQTSQALDGIDTAVKVLPSMLGGDGPRNYLLLSLTNSEIRTAGGIPGALAVINADNGRLTLGATASVDDLKHFADPVLPLTPAELTLFDPRLGKWMENVTSTPDFARSGQLAQAIWSARRGLNVDGVIAIDPVSLGYILKATGPIDAGAGITLDSSNAAAFLLSTVYATFPDTRDQDFFFATVTKKIFAALTGGKLDTTRLISALGAGASEHRIHIWSTHADEEKQLASTSMGGSLPKSTNTTSAFGVYLNDATGGKMDYYVRNAITVSSGVCRADERPNLNVAVKLSSTAPLDSATSLPSYVTGRFAFNVEPGRVRTNVYVYAPKSAQPYSVLLNGKEYAFVSATLNGQPMAGAVVELGPQESATLTFRFLGAAGTPTNTAVEYTPMSSHVSVVKNHAVNCTPAAR
jgi:hypothetical protein